jgi:two-component system, chemotaxis family, sensor kinase CheA
MMDPMEEAQDPELISEFVVESLSGLQAVEQDLLLLEDDGGADKELVNRIFRAVHSIKGAGAYLKLDNLVTVSHRAETLLDDVRAGRRGADAIVTDAVLGAVDALTAMLEAEDQGHSYDCGSILGQLDSILQADKENHLSSNASGPSSNDRGNQFAAGDQTHFPSSSLDGHPAHDPSTIQEFVSESLSGLDAIKADLSELETEGSSDPQMVRRIIQTMQLISGPAAQHGFQNVQAVGGAVEKILERVQLKTLTPSHAVTDEVMQATSSLRALLESERCGEDADCATLLDRLAAVLDDASGSQEVESISLEDWTFLSQLKDRVYPISRLRVTLSDLHQAIDIKEGVIEGLNAIGKVRHASLPLDQIDVSTAGECVIYLETMLESDILSQHLHLDVSAIQIVDLKQAPVAQASDKQAQQAPVASPVQVRASDDVPASAPPRKAAPKSDLPAITESDAPSLVAEQQAKSSVAEPEKAQRQRPVDEPTMRVPARILHELLEWTGNMVMARNQLLNEYDFRESNAFRTLSQAITGVHETVIETRMQTTGSLFERYRRVVRDLSRQLKKEVAFHIEGGDLELDRTILESFADPLTHLVRNCIDHALETPEERVAAGKNRQGNVHLRSYVQSGEIILEVQDDGRGISAEYICSKAVSKGIITPSQASSMTEEEKVMLIFEAGFSTKDQATDVSGRGVGMDVVRNNIESVGGTIDLRTRVGEGSIFAARLPLAKALVSSSLTTALIIQIATEILAIPETAISEIIQYDERTVKNIRQVDGRNVYQHRDKIVAMIDLREPLGLQPERSARDQVHQRFRPSINHKHACLVIIQFRNQLFGTVVDEVIGMQEIIVRSNPQLIQECTIFSGHTVLGNGRISLILDINGIVNKMSLKFPKQTSKQNSMLEEVEGFSRTEAVATQKMLVFNNSDTEYFAIPIELVAFIERVRESDLTLVGDREFCRLKSETLSIVRLENFLPVSPLNRELNDVCLIRPAAVEHPIGVIIGRNLAVVDVAETFESRLDDQSGIVGTFYWNDHLVMLLDLFCVLEKHSPDKISNRDETTNHARILVAEDSLFFRKLIGQYMQREEWEVKIVNDGAQAYDELINNPTRYDLVISDINMPLMDGFELVRRVREDRRFDRLPMVALTTMSEEHFREKGIALGFDRYVIKIDKREVRATVAECLRIKRDASLARTSAGGAR